MCYFFPKKKRLKRTAPSYDVDDETLKRLHLLKIDPRTEKLLRLKRRRRLQKQNKKGRRVAARRTWSKHIEYSITHPSTYDESTRWMQCRLRLYQIVTDNRFEFAIIGLIAANTVVLGCYHYPIDPDVKNVLDTINQVSKKIIYILPINVHKYVVKLFSMSKRLGRNM